MCYGFESGAGNRNYIVELGTEGRLVKMQLDELLASVEEESI